MAASPPFSDAYIASLLVRDATTVRRSTSTAYSALGLHALPSSRKPPAPAPKPNTRFLRNVLKETEGFNRALRARERDEAGGRFGALGHPRKSRDGGKHGKEHGGKEGWREDGRSERKARDERQAEEEELVRHGKRRRGPEGNGEGDCEEGLRRRRRGDGRMERGAGGKRGEREREVGREMDRRRRRKRIRAVQSNTSEDEERADWRSRRSRHQERASRGEILDTAHRERERDGPVSTQRHGPRPLATADHSSASLSRSPARRPKHSQHNRTAGSAAQPTPAPHLSDSDPLESLIGPLPPPRPPAVVSKGRGAFTRTSNIDAHFATTYDAAVDVQPPSDDDEDDWDQAIEAFRDRQKWKRQGAERLRLAGFSAEQVAKWERGDRGGGGVGEGGDVEDVRWRGRWEGREWDRGKVVDEEGFVGVRAEWRGKGEGS